MSSNLTESVCFDASRFRPFKGNSVYALSLIQELAKHSQFTKLTLLSSPQNFEFFSPLASFPNVQVRLKGRSNGGRLLARSADEQHDLYHLPGGQEALFELGTRIKPQIFTFHDANYLQGKGGYTWKQYKILSTIAMAERAAGIVFISQFAKKEFCRITRLRKCLERIPHRVIWNGCGFPDLGIRKDTGDGPWICFANQTHKRADIAIAAHQRYRESHGGNDRLIVIGQNSGQLATHKSVEFRSHLSWQELIATVRSAKGLLFPSEYEGFGLPVLEAALCGVPVISNDLPAVREIFDDAISYAPNNSVSEYAHWMGMYHKSEENIAAMATVAWQRARRITWRRCAEELVDFYKEVSTTYYNS